MWYIVSLFLSVVLVWLCSFRFVIDQVEDSSWAWEAYQFGVHRGGARFGWCRCEWACGLDVEGEVLEDGSKISKGVYCQKKQDHVFVKDSSNWSKGGITAWGMGESTPNLRISGTGIQQRMAFKEEGCEKHEWADVMDRHVSVGQWPQGVCQDVTTVVDWHCAVNFKKKDSPSSLLLWCIYKENRVVLLAAQRKTLHFMDGTSLYLCK